MKKRWKIALGLGGALAAAVLVPMAYIEGTCSTPIPGFDPHAPYRPVIGGRRAEARTWLTYPEWHIVYSAESLGRWLGAGQRPSGYGYGSDIAGFWRGFCQINRVASGRPGAGEAKVMIYTIGISFTAEMAVKAVYENTVGRVFEWIGGWHSQDDRYAATVQQRYGAFMHEVPWYQFDFLGALAGEWRTSGSGAWIRHVERRFALSSEYLVKAGYAKLIGAASGATLGADELTLRFVARATPAQLTAVDKRVVSKRTGNGLTVAEAPRYAQFTDLVGKLAAANIPLLEIAGNDDIFLTALVPQQATIAGVTLLDMPIERAGWRRVGVSVKVAALPDTIRAVRRVGGQVEHVYDY